MEIKKITIRNFKCFEDISFEFKERFTVFIGDNAKGKTTVLDGLATAAGSFLLGIEGTPARPIYPEEVRTITIDGQPKPQKPVVIDAQGELDGNPISWKRTLEGKNTTYKYAQQIRKIAEDKLQESRKRSGVVFPVLAYHGTGRLWAIHEKIRYQEAQEGVIEGYAYCWSPKSSSKEFLSWFKTYEDEVRKFSQPQDMDLLEAFKQAIVSMIPDGRWTDMAFSFKDDDLVGTFMDGGQLQRLMFHQLSDGYRNVVGMAADIAYRCIKLNPHLGKDAVRNTPGIVLIDELDLHLHPKWQKRIVEDFKRTFPRIQFIATTHSPFIVQSLHADELIHAAHGYEPIDRNPQRAEDPT